MICPVALLAAWLDEVYTVKCRKSKKLPDFSSLCFHWINLHYDHSRLFTCFLHVRLKFIQIYWIKVCIKIRWIFDQFIAYFRAGLTEKIPRWAPMANILWSTLLGWNGINLLKVLFFIFKFPWSKPKSTTTSVSHDTNFPENSSL